VSDKYDGMADAYERGDYQGTPGPVFHGLPPAWYGKKVMEGTATQTDTIVAQLEAANNRIVKLERQIAGVRQLVSS